MAGYSDIYVTVQGDTWDASWYLEGLGVTFS